jgi:LytS/YehU family sensor histidine kinase
MNACLIALFVWANHELKDLLMDELNLKQNNDKGPPKSLFIYVNIIASMVPIVFSIALKTTERWFRSENDRKEAQTIKLQSEIQHLKYQLQPHFFFNSLNNIYSLVDLDPESAKKTIHSLGKLMRYLLYDTETEKVPLQKEIDFLTQYIELMKLRFSDKITISYSFPEVPQHIKVVPLLFITLVENAFKHGIPASKKASLSFNMEIMDTFLVFTAKNQNLPKSDSDKSGSGIGLENLKKRLQLLYPDSHSFIYNVKDDTFIARLMLEIQL